MADNVSIRTYIVVGMHRSATSFLARCLHLNGVDMGKRLLPPSGENPQGYYENIDFLKLNKLILKKAGGIWYNPPSETDILRIGESLYGHIVATISKNKQSHWGWKDPRTCLTLPLYLPILESIDGNDIYIIAIFRKPHRVAQSLNKYHKLSINNALNLIKEYNSRILKYIKSFIGLKEV